MTGLPLFKTFLFKTTLKLLGIRQQLTDLGSPWQNGRIERLWRTLKQALLQKHTVLPNNLQLIKTQIKFVSVDAMQVALANFQQHYNTTRPHQSLNGITPAMAWNARRKPTS